MRAYSCLLLASLAAASGCALDDDDDGDDLRCVSDEPPTTTVVRRDPARGICVEITTTICDPSCQECPDQAHDAPANEWGLCESECTGLPEGGCHAQDGCYAAYLEDPASDPPQYQGCWQITSWGSSATSCDAFDAYDCAERDGCALYYVVAPQDATLLMFERCAAEPALP
jgi:hypothetical protein